MCQNILSNLGHLLQPTSKQTLMHFCVTSKIAFIILSLWFIYLQSAPYTLITAIQTLSPIVFSWEGLNDTRVQISLSSSLWLQTSWVFYTSPWIYLARTMLCWVQPVPLVSFCFLQAGEFKQTVLLTPLYTWHQPILKSIPNPIHKAPECSLSVH